MTPKVKNCVDAGLELCASKCIQLSPSKMKVICFGTNDLRKRHLSHVGAETIAPFDHVRDRGVLDSELTMDKHILKSPASAINVFGA